MSKFAIRNPYFIVVLCLVLTVVGVLSMVRMPVDLFPAIKLPVVVVATFYNGMPPEQIEADITGRFERFFTLASNVEHIESRSLTGVSLIKIYFQPGTDADAAVTSISNLAMANLRRLPAGTLPPVVLKFDASSLPVCLITLKGEGITETALRDLAQYSIRNQVAGVPGASVPQPFGGKYRQIMVYVDPLRLEAHQLSPMDVVRAVNTSNLILPAGQVRMGPLNYSLYTNSQAPTVEDIARIPLKAPGTGMVLVSDVGTAKDAQQLQNNIVRVDGQASVYLPVLRQGGDTNTIGVVDGVKAQVERLLDMPESLKTQVVFDQSEFVKKAISTLVHEGAIGLVLTAAMILLFLGSPRATLAVCLSIPISALTTFIVLSMGGGSINAMVLGGLALVFSRLIDNSVVVLENIYRHLEAGEPPEVAAERGGREVALPVLAATLTTAIVFFPVTFLYGVSRFLFTALAGAVVIALFASYFVALTVVPLYCARFVRAHGHAEGRFDRMFNRLLRTYSETVNRSLRRPWLVLAGSLAGLTLLTAALYPQLGVSFFPRTEAGQFVVNLKAPAGTRLENTEALVSRVEEQIRKEIPAEELGMIVSNIGVQPGFSSIYTSNSAEHTAFVQVSLTEGHKTPSRQYMARVRERLGRELPQVRTYFQSGGLLDAVLNMGLPAPIDVQVKGTNLEAAHETAERLAERVRQIPGVSDTYIPQDVDYPALRIDVDRMRSSQLGLTTQEVVGNVVTALNSSQMIAPSYWVDEKNGIDYMLTVQFPEGSVQNMADLTAIPLRAPGRTMSTPLSALSRIQKMHAPAEVAHYQLRRVVDLFIGLDGEDLGRVANEVDEILKATELPRGLRVEMRGIVEGMRQSFRSFGLGLILSVVLLYLVLVAQFRSFADPVLILIAVPPGLAGVTVALYAWGTTLNVQSLMGVVMMVGIVVSNSILIVEFTNRLVDDGMAVREAVAEACRVRLRPVLMTSLATLIGLLPMAMKLGTGSESYAPLAQAIIGGLAISVIFTVFLVPAGYVLLRERKA